MGHHVRIRIPGEGGKIERREGCASPRDRCRRVGPGCRRLRTSGTTTNKTAGGVGLPGLACIRSDVPDAARSAADVEMTGFRSL